MNEIARKAYIRANMTRFKARFARESKMFKNELNLIKIKILLEIDRKDIYLNE